MCVPRALVLCNPLPGDGSGHACGPLLHLGSTHAMLARPLHQSEFLQAGGEMLRI